MTSKTMLEEGFKYLTMIKEDADHMAAENLHELPPGKFPSAPGGGSPCAAHLFP